MSTIIDLLGTQAGYYLDHVCKTIDKKLIHIPEPNMIDKAWVDSDRNIRTLESLQAKYPSHTGVHLLSKQVNPVEGKTGKGPCQSYWETPDLDDYSQ